MRTCAAPGCDVSLEGRRRHARYCTPLCRRAAQRARDEDVPTAKGTDSFWLAVQGLNARRRPAVRDIQAAA